MTRVAGSGGIHRWIMAAVVAGAIAIAPKPAIADQGGVSFWVPGLFGSLAAVPGQPGFNFASVYYHTSVGASGSRRCRQSRSRSGSCSASANLKVNLNVDLNARANLVFLVPGYIFETPIFGGQLGVSMAVIPGQQTRDARRHVDGFARSAVGDAAGTDQRHRVGIRRSVSAGHAEMESRRPQLDDLRHDQYSGRHLRFNAARQSRLGHSAIDGGLGYTYFDPTKGHEFSVVAGTTYNFTNKHTDYRNGQDYHIDAAAAQFLSKTFFVGAVGYYYDQFTADQRIGAVPRTR